MGRDASAEGDRWRGCSTGRRAQMRSRGRGRCGVLSVALGDEVAAHIAAHASERGKGERRFGGAPPARLAATGNHRGGRGGRGAGAAGERRAGRSAHRREPRVRRLLGRIAAGLQAAGRARPAAGKARPRTGSTLNQPIESTFGTVWLRTRVGARAAGWPSSRRECWTGGRTRPSSRTPRE